MIKIFSYIILGMTYHGGITGYEIKKHIESGIGTFYRASYGSLYPALKKLTGQNLLTMSEKPQGGRIKKYYEITEEGRKIFMDWLASPVDILDGINSYLAKVYFFDLLPSGESEKQLAVLEIKYENYLNKLKAIEEKFIGLKDKEKYYYKLSTLYYGIAVTQKSADWCRYIREKKELEKFIEKG